MTPAAGMKRVNEIVAAWTRGRTTTSEAMLAILLVTGTVEDVK